MITYQNENVFVINTNTSKHIMQKRSPEKYVVNYTNSERYRRSAVPYLQRLLNMDYSKQKKDLKCLLRVNNDIVHNIPITSWKYTLLLLKLKGEFWNLEIKSFHLAPRFLGLNALLMEKSPPKDATEVLSSPLYNDPVKGLDLDTSFRLRPQHLS